MSIAKTSEYYTERLEMVMMPIFLTCQQLQDKDWDDDCYKTLHNYMSAEGLDLMREMESDGILLNYVKFIEDVLKRFAPVVLPEDRKERMQLWQQLFRCLMEMNGSVTNKIDLVIELESSLDSKWSEDNNIEIIWNIIEDL